MRTSQFYYWVAALALVFGAQAMSHYALTNQAQNIRDSIPGLVATELRSQQRAVAQKNAQSRLVALLANATNAPDSYNDDRISYGSPAARITIEGFTDIECPYCKAMHKELRQVIDSSGGVINWQVRHYPLSRHNPVAAIEAQVLSCIADSYGNRTAWAMLEAFYNDTESNGKGVGDLDAFVRHYGLSGALARNCIESDAHKGDINADYQYGRSLGITGTPAMLIRDNKTGKSTLVKGMQTKEQIAAQLQNLLD